MYPLPEPTPAKKEIEPGGYLASLAGVHAVVEAARLVPAHLAQRPFRFGHGHLQKAVRFRLNDCYGLPRTT